MVLEKWTFNGSDLNSSGKWGIESVIGGIGFPKYRGSDLKVPFQHGNRWIKKRFDRRKVILSMWIRGITKAELDDNIDEFLKIIGIIGVHSLRRILRSGEVREAQAELCSEINFVRKNPGYAKFALEFELADPFFYSTIKNNTNKTISTVEYTWVHNYEGSAPLTASIITFTGPLSNPMIKNLNNGIWLQYLGSILAGETVVLNTKDFTCKKGISNMVSAVKHGGDAYWLILENGDNSMKITTDTPGGTVKIEYYPVFF